MSTITFSGTSGASFAWDFSTVGAVTSASSTEVVLALSGGGTLSLGGAFPTLDPITNRPTSGTIDTIDFASGGETIAITTSLSVVDFFAWIDANDGAAFNTALLDGDDTITGTSGNDDLIGLALNDTIYTGGVDAVNTGTGDDTIILNGVVGGGSTFNGGDDDDTIIFSDASTDHIISAVAGQPGVIQVDDYQLIDIEHLEFIDGTFHWDTTSGLVADGYLAGTTVWYDDGNGILDPYEPFAITDSNGNFELSSYIDGPLLAKGGINIDTGLPNDLVLSAPAGSTVVNPLTSLVQSIIKTTDVTP